MLIMNKFKDTNAIGIWKYPIVFVVGTGELVNFTTVKIILLREGMETNH